jgi:hypothetical protein
VVILPFTAAPKNATKSAPKSVMETRLMQEGTWRIVCV